MTTQAPPVTISRLSVYPIKSCAGIDLQEVALCETGFDLDRAWMVVDARGDMLTQREHPRMALIRPQLKQWEMVLRAPGMLALHVQIEAVEAATRARVWGEEVAAFDMGDVAAQWMSMAITDGKQALRLVRFDPDHRRICDPRWTGGQEAMQQFSDGFPLLVCTEAALTALNDRLQSAGQARVDLDRFRPNLVLTGLDAHDEDHISTLQIGTATLKLVKPCVRCSVPDVDPQTATTSTAVAQALADYRSDARMGGQITFGMNATVLQGHDASLQVGQAVAIEWAF